MYTDGETYYYRPDQPNRVPSRPSYERQRDGQQRRAEGDKPSDRLGRLDSLLERLESTLAQVGLLVENLSERLEGREEKRTPLAVEAANREIPAGELAESGSGDVKVSLYADGRATALLGQVRIHHEDS